MMETAVITSPASVLAVLAAICSFFFFLEKRTAWKGFNYLPPLIFIYVTPVLCSNTKIIPRTSSVYDFMGEVMLPFFLVLMLMNIDVKVAFRTAGRGIFVMLLGTVGVVIGAPLSFMLVSHGLGPEAWKAYGALAGSWIGGTGNMLAVGQMVNLNESSLEFGYAVIADNAVYLIWLPILLGSKRCAELFHSFTRVPEERINELERAASKLNTKKDPLEMRHILYLIFFGFAATVLAAHISAMLPLVKASSGQVIISANTYKILLITALGIGLSFTRARQIPGSQALAMALIYLFVARMGAKADLSNLNTSVFWFLLGAYLWIFFHGAMLLLGARIFKIDVHTAAIASAANIGGAASAPIVAAYHKPVLVPVAVLMALIGYAIGNPLAYLTALLCLFVG
ncbi:DUF819 domain-containing protein [candidate division CSSED10-310 bacterium]|uniref:DUF819 domain-containing protein n=1 Tax=candidate division CSSED10-310 bacterium TaxID=2855610 RepID=A0ABV6YWC7_UNCC1